MIIDERLWVTIEPDDHKARKQAVKVRKLIDGHDTGLYSWDYLYEMASNYEAMWQDYIAKLEMAGLKRKPIV